MAALDLTNRAEVKAIANAEAKSFASEKSIAVPQKVADRAARMVLSLKDAGVEVEDSEFKAKFTAALDAAAGGKFVNSDRFLKEFDAWVGPMRPAPEPAPEEGEGEEGEGGEG